MHSCRVCLRISKNISSLSDVICMGEHDKKTFLDLYNVCTRLRAVSEDDLPQNLCFPCSNSLQLFYEFLHKAKETDAKLRQLQLSGRQTRSKANQAQDWENAETTTYAETDLNSAGRDPLEDTEDEAGLSELNEEVNKFNSDTDWTGNFIVPSASDSEDDKPLKNLLIDVKAEKRMLEVPHTTNLANQENESDLYNPTSFTEEEDEDCDFNNDVTGDVPDLVLSPEAHIFPQGRFKCETCGFNYFTTIGLKAHHEMHFPKSDTAKKKRVRGPNKKKRKAMSTTEHDETTANEAKPQNCLEVGPTTDPTKSDGTDKDKIERKPRKPKLPKPKKMFPCHVCGKHMISASKLRYHMVMHTGEKDYLCTMCPKAYSTIYALKHHMRTHTGERPYECKFCGDKFTRPTTLRSHMRRHTGERPYGCEICGKRFIQHSSMTTHMKLNHMAKTIPCPHCDKKYARQTDLNTHLLSHTGDKPFSCHLCPSRFIRQANLNKHMNQHHSGRSNEAKSAKSSKRKIQNSTVNSTDLLESTAVLQTMDTVVSPSSADVAILLTASVSSPLSVGSCNTKLSVSSVSNKAAVVDPDLAQALESTVHMPPAVFSVNSHMTNVFTMDTNNRDILGTVDHAKIAPLQGQTAAVHIHQQQQHSSDIDSLRLGRCSIDDLNRWNWPNHS